MKRDRRYQLLLLVAALILFTFSLGQRDFWDPDEPRYAGVARAMVESGDWLHLTDNGRPYTDKPPLYFWVLAALGHTGGGINEVTARIPSSLFALLTVLLTYRLGRDLFGPRSGLFAGLVLATSQRFFLEAHWVHIDMLVCLLVLSAMDAAYRALEKGENWRWVTFYVVSALGVLAKGPVALAIPAAGLFTYLASFGELSRLRETRWVWGVPAALLPAILWLWTSARGTGVEPLQVIRRQILQRFQAGVHHPRPFYYYLYSLPLEFLPWTPFLIGALFATFPHPGRVERRPLLFLYGWILGGLALLSMAAEKRPGYLLPLFPALALLIGILWETFLVRYDPSPLRPWLAGPLAAYAVVCLGGVLAVPYVARRQEGLTPLLVTLAFIYLATCAASLSLLGAGKRGAAFLGLVGGLMAGYLWISGSVLPWLNDYKSARSFCERVVHHVGTAPLAIYRDYRPAYAYYTHRRLEVLRRPEAVADFLAPPRSGFCLIDRPDFRSLTNFLSLEEIDRERVGHRTFLLVRAAPRPTEPSEREVPQ